MMQLLLAGLSIDVRQELPGSHQIINPPEQDFSHKH